MIDIAKDIGDAKTGVVIAVASVIVVYVAIQAFHWIQNVLIEREASREYYDRYGQ